MRTALHQVGHFFNPTLSDLGRPLFLQSCCVPAEGAAAGPGLILELLREVAQMLFVSEQFFFSLNSVVLLSGALLMSCFTCCVHVLAVLHQWYCLPVLIFQVSFSLFFPPLSINICSAASFLSGKGQQLTSVVFSFFCFSDKNTLSWILKFETLHCCPSPPSLSCHCQTSFAVRSAASCMHCCPSGGGGVLTSL